MPLFWLLGCTQHLLSSVNDHNGETSNTGSEVKPGPFVPDVSIGYGDICPNIDKFLAPINKDGDYDPDFVRAVDVGNTEFNGKLSQYLVAQGSTLDALNNYQMPLTLLVTPIPDGITSFVAIDDKQSEFKAVINGDKITSDLIFPQTYCWTEQGEVIGAGKEWQVAGTRTGVLGYETGNDEQGLYVDLKTAPNGQQDVEIIYRADEFDLKTSIQEGKFEASGVADALNTLIEGAVEYGVASEDDTQFGFYYNGIDWVTF